VGVNNSRVLRLPIATVQPGRVEYQFALPTKNYPVYFSSRHVELTGHHEAALTMTMLAAMRLGIDLDVSGDISATFLENQYKLMKIFNGWFPRYQPINIFGNKVPITPKRATGRIGAFFTGGVDSFYTYLKHQDEITDLIFVHGYDVRLSDVQKRQAISAMGRELEQDAGIRFIELETNSIRLFRDFGRWGLHAHGYGLGTAARLLSGYLDRLYIPSSFPSAEIFPWASHPDTDPLFSDENLMIIHDGCEASRTEKVSAIADIAFAQKHLRVCTAKIEGLYNCGRCEKCLRTMTGLYAQGQLDQFTTFSADLDPNSIKRLIINDQSARKFVRDNIGLLESKGMGDDPVCQAWREIYQRNSIQTKWLKTKKYSQKLVHKMQTKLQWSVGNR
jgi:hypothetical protein